MELFINKYKPQNLEDYPFNEQQIKFLIKLSNININLIPHLLISGLDMVNNLNIIELFLKNIFKFKKIIYKDFLINYKNINYNIKQNNFFYFIDVLHLKKDYLIFPSFINNLVLSKNIIDSNLNISNCSNTLNNIIIIYNIQKASDKFLNNLKSIINKKKTIKFILINKNKLFNKKFMSFLFEIKINIPKKINIFNYLKFISKNENVRISNKEINKIIDSEKLLYKSITVLELKLLNNTLKKKLLKKRSYKNLFNAIEKKDITKIKDILYILLNSFNEIEIIITLLDYFKKNNKKIINILDNYTKINNIIILEKIIYEIILII